MDMAPKKKRHYYGKSRNDKHQPDLEFQNVASPDSGVSSLSTTYDDSLPDCSNYSTTSTSPYPSDETFPSSPTEGCGSPYENDYSPYGPIDPSYGYEPPSPYQHPHASMGLGATMLGWPSVSATPQLPNTSKYQNNLPSYSAVSSSNGVMCPSPSSEEGTVNGKGKRTRPQKCRMCANHHLKVDVKGHKWFCKYRECKCYECNITRQTQHYMKERQKLTRMQQQRQEEMLGKDRSPEDLEVQHQPSGGGDAMDFPRKEELKRETKNIIDKNLFNQVNQVCRPKSNLRR